ncbi:MAG: hypothetical protein ACKVWR_12410 [Acidimicrobiales bacterium]
MTDQFRQPGNHRTPAEQQRKPWGESVGPAAIHAGTHLRDFGPEPIARIVNRGNDLALIEGTEIRPGGQWFPRPDGRDRGELLVSSLAVTLFEVWR